MNWEQIKDTAIVTLIGVIITGVWGYFRSIGNKIDRNEFQEEMKLLHDRISKLEGASATFVTREELKGAITELRADFKEAVNEIKGMMRELTGRIFDKH